MHSVLRSIQLVLTSAMGLAMTTSLVTNVPSFMANCAFAKINTTDVTCTSCEHRSEAGRDVDDACGGVARGTAAGSPPEHTQTGTSASV